MTKKKSTKLGAIRGSGDEHQTHEPRMAEYERLRMETIKKNLTRMEELGLKEQAKSLMARVQNNRGNQSKNKKKKVSGDDELYRPNQDMEHELDSTDEEFPVPQSNTKEKSNSTRWKIRKMKALTRKAVTTALTFKKRRKTVDLASSRGGLSTPNHTSQQQYLTRRELDETLRSEVEHLNRNQNDKENGEKDKPRRGPTMCYNVHGRSEEERLEITLNEHGQPVGPDDKTCNEFTSFLGTIARKANILPLTVKNWPILRNEKKEELWDYVLRHYIVPIEAKKWVLQTIGAAWRRYKCYLKRVHFQKYNNDQKRMMERPKRVPKTMFKDLLKIWNDDKYEERCMQNKANRLVGKEKNIMHTSGPKSFARVRYKWKKDNITTQNPTLAQMFIATRKEKLTKRKPGDLRDKLIDELQDSEKDVDSVISTLIGSNNKKKSPLNFYGRGVSSTQLKQKALMNEVEEKHAREVETLQKDYEDKRLQDRRDIANGLNSLISQLQQQNPEMSFDLSMFGSLFLDNQCEKDGNTAKKFLLHSSASTSEGVNNMEDEQDEDEGSV